MIFTLEKLREKFPEVTEAIRGNGPCFVCHCWKPNHTKGGHFRQMEINPEGVYFCHNCNEHGNILQEFPEFFDPLSELFPELFVPREKLVEKATPKIRRGGTMWGKEKDIQAPGEVIPFSSLPDDHVAVQYLRERGFDIEEMRGYDTTRALWYCTKGQIEIVGGKGTTTGRIVFPIYMLGELVGWQARYIDRNLEPETPQTGLREVWNGHHWVKFRKINGVWQDKGVPKYYTCPNMKRGSVLYGFDRARNYKEIAFVEGPLDYHRTGPQCVGTLGNQGIPTNDQIKLMKAYWDRIFWIRDPGVDPKTPRFTKALADLAPLPVYHLCLKDNKDPGATPRDSTWKQIAEHVYNQVHGGFAPMAN